MAAYLDVNCREDDQIPLSIVRQIIWPRTTGTICWSEQSSWALGKP